MVFAENLIKSAIKEASVILMSRFGERFHGELKENQSSIVTEMDVAAERKITHLISQRYPDHSIIGEEKGAVLTGSEYTWIVDPLDGTSNYAAGIPWFGILVALFQFDQPIAAGAYLPYYDLMYYAEKGKGAWRNGERIKVTAENDLKKVLFAHSTDYTGNEETTKKETQLLNELIRNVRNVRSTNCLIDFCYVADGRLGGCINYKTCIWDIAAPWLIIQEAGGLMSDLSGMPVQFDLSLKNYFKNYRVFACGENLSSHVRNIISKYDFN